MNKAGRECRNRSRHLGRWSNQLSYSPTKSSIDIYTTTGISDKTWTHQYQQRRSSLYFGQTSHYYQKRNLHSGDHCQHFFELDTCNFVLNAAEFFFIFLFFSVAWPNKPLLRRYSLSCQLMVSGMGPDKIKGKFSENHSLQSNICTQYQLAKNITWNNAHDAIRKSTKGVLYGQERINECKGGFTSCRGWLCLRIQGSQSM